MEMEEIKEQIEEDIKACLEAVSSPKTGWETKKIRAAELSALLSFELNTVLRDLNTRLEALRVEWEKSSDAQSKHTKALVWWTGVLVFFTALYAIVEAMKFWRARSLPRRHA